MTLVKGNKYTHPTYGELTFVRSYNYKGAKHQFRTFGGTLISLTFLETEELREG